MWLQYVIVWERPGLPDVFYDEYIIGEYTWDHNVQYTSVNFHYLKHANDYIERRWGDQPILEGKITARFWGLSSTHVPNT